MFGNHLPLIDTLHRGISSIPVIQNVWFTSYSFPLILLFFSFFAGSGAHYLSTLTTLENARFSSLKKGLWVVVLMLIVLTLAILASHNLNHKNYLDSLMDYELVGKITVVFVVFFMCRIFFAPRVIVPVDNRAGSFILHENWPMITAPRFIRGMMEKIDIIIERIMLL